jgi:hypothetical protein
MSFNELYPLFAERCGYNRDRPKRCTEMIEPV